MSEVENKSESIGGEERVKKEEFHVELKTKDTKQMMWWKRRWNLN